MPPSNASKSPSERKKFVPKPPLPKEDRLRKLHLTLVDQIGDGYLENGIKTCRKILALDPKSTPTFQTLLFLLLQTDDYPSALQLVNSFSSPSTPTSISSSFSPDSAPESEFEFEKAYCLYRLHREDEALRILEGLKGSDRSGAGFGEDENRRKCLLLEGQILYRKSSLPSSLQIYTDLLSSTPTTSPDHPDLTQNIDTIRDCMDFDPVGRGRMGEKEKRGLEAVAPSIPQSMSIQPSGSGSSTRPRAAGAMTPGARNEKEKGASSGKTGCSAAGAKAAAPGSSSTPTPRVRKTRHPLPKSVAFSEKHVADPERWLPLRLRTSQPATNPITTGASNNKKRGQQNKSGGGAGGGPKKEGMGAGMTQGSVGESGHGKGGGGGGKKGKRK